MTLIVVGSSSAGNAYILKGGDSTLLIEAGVHIRKIKQALSFDLENVHCIVSHSHGDHGGHMRGVLDSGIDVYAGMETLQAKGVESHHRARPIIAGKKYQIGGFKVKAFDVIHDVPCFGFLIDHPESGRIVFLTDSAYSEYTFPGVNNMILEANHEVEIMENNGTPGFLKDRIVRSHMNLQTCKELLRANDLTAVNNIVLIHLSDSNSDAIRFKREIQELTGKTVYIAEAGLVVENFNVNPF